MALTREYPNNITPGGTKVGQGLINDDAEIKRILGLIDNFGIVQLSDTKRNSVLSAHTTNGDPDYLSASGLKVAIDGTVKPVYIAFANGFNERGAVDYIGTVDFLQADAWTLPSNSTSYLYIDRDSTTCLLSFGYTTSIDTYSKTAPTSPVLDQHYYNTVDARVYRWNGSAWEVKQRVFVGKAVTDAATATLTRYPLRSLAAFNVEGEIARIDGDVTTLTTSKLSKTENAASATKLQTARNINNVPFDGTADITIPSDAAPGVTNYIASGGKITNTSGLTVTHGAIEASVSSKTVLKAAGDTQTIGAKRLGLLTLDKAGTRDVQYAADPTTFIDNSTVVMYKLDGSATCPNLAYGISSIAVANDLTKGGTVSPIDGIFGGSAASDTYGSGNYTSASVSGFPVGASVRQVDILYEHITNNSARRYVFNYGSSSGYYGFEIGSSNNFCIDLNTTLYDTGFAPEVGKMYLVSMVYDGSTFTLYVNGLSIFSVAITLSTVASSKMTLFGLNSTYDGSGIIHYLEVRNALRTSSQISTMAAKYCIPFCWTDIDGNRKNITSQLPVDTISLGMVRTSSSGVWLYNDADWGYGRREKVFNGNRVYQLPYTSSSGTVSFPNPFGTENVKVTAFYKATSAANGHTEIYPTKTVNPYTITLASTGSGYVGGYVEVLEDD